MLPRLHLTSRVIPLRAALFFFFFIFAWYSSPSLGSKILSKYKPEANNDGERHDCGEQSIPSSKSSYSNREPSPILGGSPSPPLTDIRRFRRTTVHIGRNIPVSDKVRKKLNFDDPIDSAGKNESSNEALSGERHGTEKNSTTSSKGLASKESDPKQSVAQNPSRRRTSLAKAPRRDELLFLEQPPLPVLVNPINVLPERRRTRSSKSSNRRSKNKGSSKRWLMEEVYCRPPIRKSPRSARMGAEEKEK